MSFFLNYVVSFIFTLGILVLVHEFGHFLLAKLVGIRVERFSIGFPPRLFGKKWGDTDYCISAIPLGGYVKMSGMIDESMDKDGIKGEPWEFMSKPVWARFLAIFAGPAFNLLLAAFIYSGIIYFSGLPKAVEPTYAIVGSVSKGSPADSLGLQEGDRITSIEGQSVQMWEDLVDIIRVSANKEITVEWERNGQPLSGKVTPVYDPMNEIGLIGISAVLEQIKVGPFKSIALGFTALVDNTIYVIKSFGLLINRKVSVRESLGGPIRIAQETGRMAQSGFKTLLNWIALLSITLGIINLFPMPVLDGGHILILLIEGIIRKPLSTKTKLAVNQVGFALLLTLIAFVIVNDVINIIK